MYLNILIDCTTSSNILLARAENLNYEYSPDTSTIQRFNKNYNIDVIQNYIDNNSVYNNNNVSDALQEENTNLAVHNVNDFVKGLHQKARTPKHPTVQDGNNIIMHEANLKFKTYCECLSSEIVQNIQQSLNEYQAARKLVTHTLLKGESSKWSMV